MGDLFTNIFGGKSWTHSLTAWGLVIYLAGETAVAQICGAELISVGICDTLNNWISSVGVVLTALGIRKATNS